MTPLMMKSSALFAVIFVATSACSNGGGSSDTNDSRGSNSLPSLQLDDGDVLGGGNSVVRIPAGDDTGIVRVDSTIVRQGRLQECSGRFADESLVSNSLVDACLADQPGCAVTFQPADDLIEVIPPPLYAPIGVEYDLSLVDRDGSVTDPVRAVFCFDVGVNLPPVATPDTFQVTYPSRIERRGVRYDNRCEKVQGSQGVLANDEDDEHVTNTCLTAELVELPRYASNLSSFQSSFGSDGSFVYEAFNTLPPENSNGRVLDSFSYRVTDGVNPASDPVRVEIVYTNDNRAPQAADDSFTIEEDSDVQELAVLNNDVDPDALPLTVVGISNGPGNGIATIRNGTLIEYRARAGFVGQDSFTYTAEDSGGLTVTAIVTVTVTNVNDAPVAVNDMVSTNENVPVDVRVLGNDTDVENNPLTVESVATPLHGTAVISASGVVTYTPETGYSGPDSFEYTISDGVASSTATVVVTVVFVNVGPVAVNDQLFLSEGASEEFNLLDNDTDGDSDTLRIVSVSSPANGVAVLLATGNVRYTPNDGFNGSDNFSYTISDGTVEATGQVSVSITAVNDAPVAVQDSVSTPENTAITITPLGNDTDADGDELTIVSVGSAGNGVATLRDSSSILYTPAAGFSGVDSFSYTISDGTVESSSQVSIAVSLVNDTPLPVNDSTSTAENTSVVINVLSNDGDPDGDSLTITSVGDATNGAATQQNSSSVLYTPNAGFSGTDSFSYTVSDGTAEATAQVTVAVSLVNEDPLAVDDNASTAENTAVVVNVLANDSDPDGDRLTITGTGNAVSGSATVSADNQFVTFTPNNGFSGQAGFSYTVVDGNGGSSSASVTVLVSSSNANPVATDDVRSTEEDDPVGIAVLDNDSDPDGDSLSLSVLSQPANGTATLTAQGNLIVYSPATGFSGVDTFTYQISDGNGGLAVATVTVTVTSQNVAPTAVNDALQVLQGGSVSVNVLANDTDADGDSLSVAITAPSTNGAATVLADNTISYTPAAAFAGNDAIGYTINDGNGGTSSATVAVTVTPVIVNNPPTASGDAAQATQGQPANFNVLANDSDPDGDSLTVSITTLPGNGTASVLPDNRISYTSAASFTGMDTLVYAINDGNGGTDSATVSITVVSSNTAPVAFDDTAATLQGQLVSVNVLLNDSDADGNTLTVTSVTPGANGTTAVVNGEATYVPAAAFTGVDTFTYTVSDNNGGVATAAVTVTVSAGNTPPVAQNDSAVTLQATPVNIPVLANDGDADGDTLTVAILTGPANGSASVAADNSINYVPLSAFSGPDSIVYSIDDANGGTATATISIEVTAVVSNQAPVALDDTATTDQDQSVVISVLLNDSDPDGDLISVSTATPPTNGTSTVNPDGTISYSPLSGFSGSDSFTYTISDGSVTATATVSVTVNALPPTATANTPPVAVDDSASAVVGAVTRIRVLDNDSDADGDRLTVLLGAGSAPANGTVEIHNNRRWINYTARTAGTDTFSYLVEDGNGGTDSAVVTVAVSDF